MSAFAAESAFAALDDPSRDRGRFIASVFLHPGCNLACEFCVGQGTGAFDTMTAGQADEVVRALRAAGFANVVFGGGEPTTWPHDLWALASRTQDLGCFVQVSTNGVALPDDFACRPGVDRFLLPLESADSRVHDAMRGLDGHHALVLGRLAQLRAAGRPVTITTVVGRGNVEGLPALRALLGDIAATEVRIHAWHVYRMVAAGPGHEWAERVLDRDAWIRTARAVRALEPGFPVLTRPDVRRSRAVEYVWLEGGRMKLGSLSFARKA